MTDETPLEPTAQDIADIEAMNAEEAAVEPVGRNAKCPCGSGKKYKLCHGAPGRGEQIVSDQAPVFHAILKVWLEVLKPAAEAAKSRIEPAWANRIIAQYSQMVYADMPEYRDRYFGKIAALQDILQKEIDTDPECLNAVDEAQDRTDNALHYKNLLIEWQLAFTEWELAWDCTDPAAAAELAAMSEVHKMFFSQEGLVAFLDNIKLEYTEDDQKALSDAIENLKAGR